MPIFQRSSYSDHIEANVISLFDPGLFLHKNLKNTWFVGTAARYYADYMGDMLNIFFKNRKVNRSDVIIYGTSAGGLPALKIAQKNYGCTVWLGNVQTRAYEHSAFDKMLPVLFPKITKEDCVRKFSDRFDATMMDGEYDLHYFQNKSDRFHFERHYKFYKKWYEGGEKKVCAKFYEYDDPVSGHATVGKEEELGIINKLLNGSSLGSKFFYNV